MGVSTVDNGTRIMRAYEGVRYTDGKGTIESIFHSMFSASGALLKKTEYSFTYGDPSKGQIPDTLYSATLGGRGFTFAYDRLGRLTERTILFNGDDGVETYTYKAKNSSYTSTVVESMTDFTGALHTYTYDNNGNILSETIGDQTIEYVYDSQNRLVEYYDPIANRTGRLAYDDRGNILEHQFGGYLSKTELPQYGWDIYTKQTYTYGDTVWADLLTNYNGTAITYDEIGNPLTWRGRNVTLTWDNGRQLTQFRDSSSQYDYEYTADGLRTKKTLTNRRTSAVTKTTEYYIVDGQYIGEVTTVNGTDYVIAYVYDENGNPAGINFNGSAYYFSKNLQGDVIALMDYTGAVVARYTYDVWGDLISVTDASGTVITSATHVAILNPFRYRGYMYDSETGFYYVSSRYYDPEVGRWLNADIPETLFSDFENFAQYNLFAYCFNSPAFNYDYRGYWTFSINVGFSMFFFGKGNSHSLSLTFTEDYWGIQYTKCTPQDDTITQNEQLGTEIGMVTGVQYTEKNTLEELEGKTTAIGGDVLLGGDILLDSENEYMGWQWSGTVGESVGVHKTTTDTNTIFKLPTINLPKLLKKFYN